jgi:hypothetical protein
MACRFRAIEFALLAQALGVFELIASVLHSGCG